MMLTSTCKTFQVIEEYPFAHTMLSPTANLWISKPFIHLIFFWTNLNIWTQQYLAVMIPIISICAKWKTNVLFLNHYLHLSFSYFLKWNKWQILPYSLSLHHTLFQAENFFLFRHSAYESYSVPASILSDLPTPFFFSSGSTVFSSLKWILHSVFKMWRTGSYHDWTVVSGLLSIPFLIISTISKD